MAPRQTDRAARKMSTTNGAVPEPQEIYTDYRELCQYEFLADMYYGIGGVSGRTSGVKGVSKRAFRKAEPARSFITPNPTENFYETRVRKSYYTNNYRRYIDTKYKGVFKIPPVTTVTAEGSANTLTNHPYTDFVTDINGAGMHKNVMMENILSSCYRDEVVFVVMDRGSEGNPRVDRKVAASVDDYTTDDFGGLTMIQFLTSKRDGGLVKQRWEVGRMTESEATASAPSSWRVTKQVDLDPSLGIPVLALFASPREDVHEYLPRAQSYAIAALCVGLYEAASLLDWLLEKQGHDTMYVVGEITGVKEGLTNIMQIENMESGSATAGILSPDANKATVHQARIEQRTKELFELMLDGGVLVSRSNNAAESGIAKSYTFSPVNDALLESTKLAKMVDKWLEDTYKLYMGGSFVATTHYREDYAPVVATDLMTLREVLRVFEERGLTANAKSTVKKMILSLNGVGDRTEIQELLAEIDQFYVVPDSDGDGI